MYRNITEKLEDWYNKENKKPLIVLGARQIGKTYIIDEFAKSKNVKYIHFDFIKEQEAITYANISDYKTMVESLQFKYDFKFSDPNIFIFFDEIQETPYLIQHLKYLCIDYPGVKIICAGSLLGVSFKTMNISFPVGYVERMYMYPMNFEEFLIATGNKKYISVIEDSFNNNKPMDENFHKYLIEQYHRFTYLGGMPEVINNYINNGADLSNINKNIISDIVDIYKEDMSKYVESENDVFRIRRIYDNIVSQLSKKILNFNMPR